MPNALLEKAQALGMKPAGRTNPLLVKAQQMGMQPAGTAPQVSIQQPRFMEGVNNAIYRGTTDVLKGAAKGIGSTLFGIDKLARKAPLFGSFLDKINPDRTGGVAPEFIKPEGTAQSVGFGAEQIAEYLLPSSAIGKGAKAINAISATSKLGEGAKLAVNVLGRAGFEGVGAGAVRAAQTGSATEGVKVGATVGVLSGIVGGIGAGLRKTGLPEKLYSQIYKNTYDDMTQSLRTGALQNLQKTNPTRFNELVKSGIINSRANGAIEFDPTLAKEALDRGLRGSLKNMSNEVVRKTLDLEEQARKIAAAAPQKAYPLPEAKKYLNILNTIKTDYADTLLPHAKTAAQFIPKVEQGTLSGEDVLELRRFLDGMRRQSSYRPNASLTVDSANLKKATDELRTVLNTIPGMEPVMYNYRFYIQALESLGREAAKRSNSAVVNLIDTALFGFGGGMAGLGGAAVLPLTRRALTLPSVLTGIGSKVQQGTTGNFGRVLRGAVGTAITPQK